MYLFKYSNPTLNSLMDPLVGLSLADDLGCLQWFFDVKSGKVPGLKFMYKNLIIYASCLEDFIT